MLMSNRIVDWQCAVREEELLLGISTSAAVLDVATDRPMLARALEMLESRDGVGMRSAAIGRFGSFKLTLNDDAGEELSIVVDGPAFGPHRTQSAAIWVNRADLRDVLRGVLDGRHSP
jgi:hypothetical protein